MPDRVIEIPGVGNIAFPDTMSEADINAAAAKIYREGQQPKQDARVSMPPPDAATRGMLAPSAVTDTPKRGWLLDMIGNAHGQTARATSHPDAIRAQGNFLRGVKAGAASTVYHGGDLLRRGYNGVVPASMETERIINQPDVQAAMTPPDDALGKLGFGVEQIAEFAVPLARVSRAVTGSSLLTRAVAEGAASGSVAAVQGGGDVAGIGMAAAGGALLPVGAKVVTGAFGAARRAAAGAQEGGVGGAMAGAMRAVAPSDPKTMLVQGLKPRATKVNFEQSIDRALPELKAVEATLGKPIESVDELLTATKQAKRTIQAELDQLRGPQQAIGKQIDLSPVADGLEANIPRTLQVENPQAAQKLREAAQVYRQPFSLDDVETLLREANAELEGFYAKFPPGQRSALTANPEAMALNARAQALRDTLYRALDDPGGGEAARELNRRYGALLDIEDAAFRRSNVAKRQQPESLSEQIGKVRAASDMMRGTWRLLHGDLSGAADIAAAKAGRETATFLKEQQTTDALIRRAFQSFRGERVPVTMPQPRSIAGLLGPGPRITPPPADASFVRSVPAVAQPSNPRRLLSPPSSEPATPPRRIFHMGGDVAPDASSVTAKPAAPIDYAVDPTDTVKAGGFRVKQYSGDPAAAQAAVAKPEVRGMLERMLEDLNTFTPQRGRLIGGSKARMGDNETVYAYGGPGSPVGDDIRVISEQNVGNAAIVRAIKDLMAGKLPSSRLHTAALDAAEGYLEKRPGYRGPSVPAAQATDDDGFEAFSRAVDDLADEP